MSNMLSQAACVPCAVGAETHMVATCFKADFSGRLLARHGECSISNWRFVTRLPGPRARKAIQSLSNWTAHTPLRQVTADVATDTLLNCMALNERT